MAARPVARPRVRPGLLLSAALLLPTPLLLSACAGPQHAAPPDPVTYYLSPSGDDAAAGTSPATAWRSLGRASRAILRPGTRLLLSGGGRFAGQLTLGRGDGGEGARPVVIGSYGTGQATIASSSAAVYVYDTAGIDITGLNLIGQPSSGAASAGVSLYNDLPAGHRLEHVVIDHVSARGFANGIVFGGRHDGAGFGDVLVTNCVVNGNVNAGLASYGPVFDARSPGYANQHVTVSAVTASGNAGNPAEKVHNTGNGIVLGSVRDATVTWSTASGNGGNSMANRGPIGIWTYDSADVVIEHSLSFGNQTRNRVDGNGFGLDQNTSDSVLQDDLSYGNDGPGFLVYSNASNGAQRNNVVRDNISSGDVQDGNDFYASIAVLGTVTGTQVDQNTVVTAPGAGAPPPALRLGPQVRGIMVRNNIFRTGYGPIVAAGRALPPAAAQLQGNDYFSARGPWSITWGPAAYGSLAAWRAGSSQELVRGQPAGFAVDPRLAGPVLNLSQRQAGPGGAADGFMLDPGSPLIGAGLDLARLGMRPGATDYAGRPQPAQHPNVGAQ